MCCNECLLAIERLWVFVAGREEWERVLYLYSGCAITLGSFGGQKLRAHRLDPKFGGEGFGLAGV